MAAAVVLTVVMSGCAHSTAKNSVPPPSSIRGMPSEFVVNDFMMDQEELQVYSTKTGQLVRNLDLSGLPPNVVPTDSSAVSVGDAGREAFWAARGRPGRRRSSTPPPGSVVETPLHGGTNRIVASGDTATPSPDSSHLFVVTSSLQGGAEPAGFSVVDLATGRVTPLPPIQPLRGFETFAWLPDGRTVMAFYPGYSGCAGGTNCDFIPVAPRPAAWTVDTANPTAGWHAIAGVSRQLANVTVLGPGRLPGTVAADIPDGNPQLLTLRVTGRLQVVDRVHIANPCYSVDHTGTNFLCSTGKGVAAQSFTHPEPDVIAPSVVGAYSMAWW